MWIVYILINLPVFAKFSRSVMIDILSHEYITTAQGKGVPEFKVIFKHAFANSIVGIIGIMGVAVNTTIFSGCLIEAIFRFNGIGNLATDATLSRDYPVMLACIMVLSTATVTLNLIFDILMHLVDPSIRIRQEV